MEEPRRQGSGRALESIDYAAVALTAQAWADTVCPSHLHYLNGMLKLGGYPLREINAIFQICIASKSPVVGTLS